MAACWIFFPWLLDQCYSCICFFYLGIAEPLLEAATFFFVLTTGQSCLCKPLLGRFSTMAHAPLRLLAVFMYIPLGISAKRIMFQILRCSNFSSQVCKAYHTQSAVKFLWSGCGRSRDWCFRRFCFSFLFAVCTNLFSACEEYLDAFLKTLRI